MSPTGHGRAVWSGLLGRHAGLRVGAEWRCAGMPVNAAMPGRFAGRYARPPDGAAAALDARTPALTVHVDLERIDQRLFVSGEFPSPDGQPHDPDARHFLAQASIRELAVDRLQLDASGFELVLDGRCFDTLQMQLQAPTAHEAPTAAATFSGAGGHLGPIELIRTSPWFRSVVLAIDSEPKAEVVTAFDPARHPDHPADLRSGRETIDGAYRRERIEVIVESLPVLDRAELMGDGRWSDRELHDAMLARARSAAPGRWDAWLLYARRYKSLNTLGVMFDSALRFRGEDNLQERQGAAVFVECIELDRNSLGSIPRKCDPPVDEAFRREVFFTAVHELGHVFNLAHPHPAAGGVPSTPWRPGVPLPEKDHESLTWMNYPTEYSRRVERAGRNVVAPFYRRFRYRFHPSEQLFLRHAPSAYVMPGHAAFRTNHARAVAPDSWHRIGDGHPGAALRASVAKREFRLGEPVHVELRVSNVSDAVIEVPEVLRPKYGTADFCIVRPDGSRVVYTPLCVAVWTRASHELPPGGKQYESVEITVGANGFEFRDVGGYELHAVVHLPGGTVCAEPVAFEVLDDGAMAGRSIPELFDREAATVYFHGGTDVLERVIRLYEQLGESLDPDHLLRSAVVEQLAGTVVRPYLSVDWKRGRIRSRGPDPPRARALLREAARDIPALAAAAGNMKTAALVSKFAYAAHQADATGEGVAALKALSSQLASSDAPADVLAHFQRLSQAPELLEPPP